jgi:hypothetical protein
MINPYTKLTIPEPRRDWDGPQWDNKGDWSHDDAALIVAWTVIIPPDAALLCGIEQMWIYHTRLPDGRCFTTASFDYMNSIQPTLLGHVPPLEVYYSFFYESAITCEEEGWRSFADRIPEPTFLSAIDAVYQS